MMKRRLHRIQEQLDEAVTMLNKRQLMSGIAMVMKARHDLDEIMPWIMSEDDAVTLENADRHLARNDSWANATNDHAEAMLTGKPCLCRKCFR